MENNLTFSGLEEIIRTAIKISCDTISDIAEKIGMSKSGLYCFMNKQNHISIDKGDKIIEVLKETNRDALQIAAELYKKNKV